MCTIMSYPAILAARSKQRRQMAKLKFSHVGTHCRPHFPTVNRQPNKTPRQTECGLLVCMCTVMNSKCNCTIPADANRTDRFFYVPVPANTRTARRVFLSDIAPRPSPSSSSRRMRMRMWRRRRRLERATTRSTTITQVFLFFFYDGIDVVPVFCVIPDYSETAGDFRTEDAH